MTYIIINVAQRLVHVKETSVSRCSICSCSNDPKVACHLQCTQSFPEEWHQLVGGYTIGSKICKTELKLSTDTPDEEYQCMTCNLISFLKCPKVNVWVAKVNVANKFPVTLSNIRFDITFISSISRTT